jgi:hypothetical protein
MNLNSTTQAKVNGYGVLRSVLEHARAAEGCSMGALTVLSAAVDPYRLDTPAGHRDGQWLAEKLALVIAATKKIHWRGLHYALVMLSDLIKPNGARYLNTDEDWSWLQDQAGKAARWLGYIGFDRITDNRNAAPIIHRKAWVKPQPFVSVGIDIKIPDVDDLNPFPYAKGFEPRQAYHYVIFGEKASLEDVVLPVARAKQADLYLPTGEISDTLVYQIAKDANADGRPLVLFTLADCDPAGYQMPVSIGRKLQAFRDMFFPDLRFEVVQVALTVDQVRELALPSTPLKETEKRADKWRQAFGVEQTEIDALATLQPEVLRQIIEDAFVPYYDGTLKERVEEAETEWNQAAEEALQSQIDQEALERVRTEASTKLSELRTTIDDINERLNLSAAGFILPEIEVPEPELDEGAERQALVSLDDDWVAATRAMIAHKQYGNDAS